MDEAAKDLVFEQMLDSSKEEKKESQRFTSVAGLRQNHGFTPSADRITQLFFTGTYRFKKPWSVSLEQMLNHHYWTNPKSSDVGLRIEDTILSIEKEFDSHKNRINIGFSSTLPLSYHSRFNDVLTVSTAYLNWNLKLTPLLNFQSEWIKNPIFFIQPFYRYHLSLYTTTPTGGRQSLGGSPLPEFSFGIRSVGFKVNITDYFSLNGSYGMWAIFLYKTRFKRDKNSPYDRGYPQQYYTFSLSGSLKIKERWEVSLSYTHLDRRDKDGRLEMVVFDNRDALLSVWSLSATYSFSL